MSFLVVQLAGALLRERKGRREDEREGGRKGGREGGGREGREVGEREGRVWMRGRKEGRSQSTLE